MAGNENEGKPTGEEPKPEEQGTEGQTTGDGGAEGQGGDTPEDTDEPTDNHGQPGINREKYRRDMKAKDEEIAQLRAQLEEKSKTEEGRADLQKQIDELKAKREDEALTYALRDAGCRDPKAVQAAKVLIGDYEGDVAKLKDGCPFLFSTQSKQTGSTGVKPAGSATDAPKTIKDALKQMGEAK